VVELADTPALGAGGL